MTIGNEIDLRNATLEMISSNQAIHDSLELIGKSCNNEFFIIGGFIRDTFFGTGLGHDIDIIVKNGDQRIHNYLDALKTPYKSNRHEIREYTINEILFDIYEPSQFQIGFDTLIECLEFFDLKINALAFDYAEKKLVNPIGGIGALINNRAGINLLRRKSNKVPLFERCILVVRLIKIIEKYEQLQLTMDEVALVRGNLELFTPEIRNRLSHRYPGTFEVFQNTANTILDKQKRCHY